MVSEIIRLLSETCQSIGDYISNLIYSKDSQSFSLFGSILLCFCGLSFVLFLILKIYKIFGGRFKENCDSTVADEHETCDSVSDEHEYVTIESEYHCVYCGSVSSSNKHNCRNCGSDEFKRVG